MTNLIWTLDNEGRPTAIWNTPASAHSFLAQSSSARWAAAQSARPVVRTLIQAGATPFRLSLATALTAYFHIQCAFAR